MSNLWWTLGVLEDTQGQVRRLVFDLLGPKLHRKKSPAGQVGTEHASKGNCFSHNSC